jgi:uncharacterized membrane protein
MANKKVPTHEELKKGKTHRQIKNANEEHRKSLTTLEQFAVWITDHIGSMGFFIIIVAWTFIWLGWNTLGPETLKFDPFPAFVLWLFLSNVLQIFLMPLIMIGQNLQGRHSEIRAESDFEINVKAEKEIETILIHLENQNDLMLRILNHLEKQGKKPPK